MEGNSKEGEEGSTILFVSCTREAGLRFDREGGKGAGVEEEVMKEGKGGKGGDREALGLTEHNYLGCVRIRGSPVTFLL